LVKGAERCQLNSGRSIAVCPKTVTRRSGETCLVSTSKPELHQCFCFTNVLCNQDRRANGAQGRKTSTAAHVNGRQWRRLASTPFCGHCATIFETEENGGRATRNPFAEKPIVFGLRDDRPFRLRSTRQLQACSLRQTPVIALVSNLLRTVQQSKNVPAFATFAIMMLQCGLAFVSNRHRSGLVEH